MSPFQESNFRQLCSEKNLAVTHQRLVIYSALMKMQDHPSPEQVFDRVRSELPSISLATVYKTVNLFLIEGIVCEVSPFHGSLRIEPNTKPHFHFICTRCHGITDLAYCRLDELPLKDSVPEGFQVQQISAEVRGICRQCSESRSAAHA
jgi:Fur family transcriptional regulator, peroxide stress response regulator